MLFEYLGRPIKFHLVYVDDEEKIELSRLITANGGVVSEDSLIKFTSRNPHLEDEDVYHVNFIRNCVKQNKILDITEYRYEAKGIGCPMSQFLRGSTSCMAFQSPNDSNPIRILSGTEIEDYLQGDNFRLTSSNSDENIKNTSSWIDCRRKKSLEKSSDDDTAWSSSEDEKATNVTTQTEDNRLNQPSYSTWTGTRRFVSKNKSDTRKTDQKE